MGQADVHHIGLHLLHHLVIVGKERGSLRQLGSQLLLQVAGTHQFNSGIFRNGVQMHPGNISQAKDSSTNHEAFLLFTEICGGERAAAYRTIQ